MSVLYFAVFLCFKICFLGFGGSEQVNLFWIIELKLSLESLFKFIRKIIRKTQRITSLSAAQLHEN